MTTSLSAAPTSTAPPDAPYGRPADVRMPGPRRYGWLFAAVWLYFLYQPLWSAWTSHGSVAWRVVAIVALLAFAVGFMWFFIRLRAGRGFGRVPVATVGPVLAGGLALLALAAPGAGEQVMSGLVYIGVTAAMTLPVRQALAVVAALVAVVLGLPYAVPGWEPLGNFVPSLVLGCFAAFGVSQVIVRNKQLLEARAQLVDLAVTEERERLARDVHDILGHSLTVITVKTELAGRLLEATGQGESRARAEVADAERLAREALADVRATASGMRQVSLTGELAAARRALTAAGIEAELPTAIDGVPARNRELFAWALREGVTNVVRHSGASWCGVRLAADSVEVADDGVGPVDGGTGGTGLRGLRDRAAGVGAGVETGRSARGGFLLRVVAGAGA